MTQIDTSDTELKQLGHIYHGIGALTTLSFIALAFTFVLLPLGKRVQVVRDQQSGEQQFLDQHRDLEATIQDVTLTLQQQNDKLAQLTEQIPSAGEEAKFLGQLHVLANQCELDLGRYTPGNPVSHVSYSTVDITVDATASYPALCRFLAGLSGLPRLCELDRLVIEPRAKDLADYSVTFVLRIYFASPDQISAVKEQHA